MIRKQLLRTAAMSAAMSAALSLAVLTGTAQASLVGRDLNNDGTTDAFYDTDFNITWFIGADPIGPATWQVARDSADNFVWGIYSDWRLPSALNRDGSGPCSGYNCTQSELGHLFYTELGNVSGGTTALRTGGFINMQASGYWTATDYAAAPADGAWAFSFGNGDQRVGFKGIGGSMNRSLYVRDGDIAAPVPEPASLWLLLAGLAAVATGTARRRRTA